MLLITVSCHLGYLLQGSECNKHGRCFQNLQGSLKYTLPRCCALKTPVHLCSMCHHAETVKRKYCWELGGSSGFSITSRAAPSPSSPPPWAPVKFPSKPASKTQRYLPTHTHTQLANYVPRNSFLTRADTWNMWIACKKCQAAPNPAFPIAAD